MTTLHLLNFRNHADTRLDLGGGAGAVVLTGDNGAGKTNLLEAVSLLSVGRGLRGAALSAMAGPAHGGFTVSAGLELGDGGAAVALGTGTRAEAPERRVLRVNGAGAALSSLSEWLSVVWLTPAMDRLFSDTAGARRRFLDRLVLALDGAHGARVTRYEAAMRERSRLLAADALADPAWLTALEAGMAEHGSALARARRLAVEALGEVDAPADGFPRARLALAGEVWEEPGALAAALLRSRGADAAAGRALAGPHRADLAVAHAAKNMAAGLCSTGEQKALLVGIVLAHAQLVGERRGRTPLLLLDEVAAHLDPERRGALFGRLGALGAQTWVTGTDAALFAGVDGLRLTIRDGRVDTK